MSYKGYVNKVEFIKNEFKNYYVDKGPENGILQGFKYEDEYYHDNMVQDTAICIL